SSSRVPSYAPDTPVYSVGELENPYHRTGRIRTSLGTQLEYFKLLGAEWNPELGARDKRYPIRNGVGNSKLYCTFYGYIDRTGRYSSKVNFPITHPLSIIHHHLHNYAIY